MKNKWILILILLTGINFIGHSQLNNFGILIDSRMEIQSIDQSGKPFEAHTGLCYLFLNLNTGDFSFKTDAYTFETSDPHLDSILDSNGSQAILFKGNMQENLSKFLHEEDSGKMYNMKGVLTINGMDILCVAQYTPISIGDKKDTQGYRLDLRLVVEANKINIAGLENNLKKEVFFEVNSGKLNITN